MSWTTAFLFAVPVFGLGFLLGLVCGHSSWIKATAPKQKRIVGGYQPEPWPQGVPFNPPPRKP